MTVRKLLLVLFLPLLVCFSNEDMLLKMMGKKSEATRICTNETLNDIVMIICKISTERSRGEECQLLYRRGKDFEHKCDSRFTLMKENQTVFLQLINLTKEDSGNYTCECVYHGGTYKLRLNVTVEDQYVSEEEEAHGSTGLSISAYLITAAAVVSVTGVTLGFSYWIKSCDCSRSETSGLSVRKKSCSLNENVSDDHYRNLRQPANDLYQNITTVHHQRDIKTHAARSAQNVQVDNQEMVQCQIYENV